ADSRIENAARRRNRSPRPRATESRAAHHPSLEAANPQGNRLVSIRRTAMKKTINLNVNGIGHTNEVEPRLLLVHYLRDVLELTGTHVGCETSLCGACTVMIDGQAVKSCTMFAVQADGSSVTTIEGFAKNGELHPVQEGFWERHGLQCGYCTPGM